MWPGSARAFSAGAPEVVDVAIKGGGIVGALLAAALAFNPLTKSLSVALLDERPPAPLPSMADLPPFADTRVSALNPASVSLLRSVGAWRALAPAAAPFADMQVWDSGGGGHVRCDAASVGADVLGYAVEERLAAAALHQRLRSSPGVRLMMPAGVAGVELPPYSPVAQLDGGPLVQLQLEGGGSLHARLLVGADGAASRMRQWAQIRSVGGGGEQRWLAATLATASPSSTAFLRFLPTGPIALLPVRGGHSSLAWSCPPEMAAQLQALPRHELAAAVTQALAGPLQAAQRPQLSSLLRGITAPAHSTLFVDPPVAVDVVGEDPCSFPLAPQHAGRYVRPRVALIGDAAHGSHTLPGQGVNLGLADARALASAIASAVEAGQDFGAAAWLEQLYEAPQRRVNGAVAGAMAALTGAFAPQGGPLAGLRGLGLDVINASPVLKQTLLRLAMQGLGGPPR